ncbi:MAG: hypothetical protein M1835_005306 [Candelina submexicana]|nr:MAG: hypothetical protein M1835_005306 [Candelina submexicana]
MDDDSTLDIAASMGFTSFGSKPVKKRKFNPKIDAAVDSSVIVGSGGNSIPAGKARGGRGGGSEGCEGCGGEKGEGEGEGDGGDPEGSPWIIANQGGGGEAGLAKEVEKQEEKTQCLKQNPGQTHHTSTRDPNTSTYLQHPSLPPKPAFAAAPLSTAPAFEAGQSIPSQAGQITREEAQRLRRGVRDGNGDIAYYDASFVEDPWERLEGGRRGLRG